MGVMNEAFGASEQQVPVDGNLKCVRALALAGKTRALVSLTSAGKEHHVWVQSISKLATSAVGKVGVLSSAVSAVGCRLLGVLEDQDNELGFASPDSLTDGLSSSETPCASSSLDPFISVQGDTLSIQFGDASIDLRKDGTIVFRGTHIASYSSGANKIRGTTIELN